MTPAWFVLKHANRHNKTTPNEQYTRAVILSTCDLTTINSARRRCTELVSRGDNEAHKPTLKRDVLLNPLR